ncbi:MAG: hypothetical protein JWO91_2295 [Acidobacteriaceae bacterium]|jgi:hypothetical protein|nr:hypothetical protein [Acidobacteriaceae bacterium]
MFKKTVLLAVLVGALSLAAFADTQFSYSDSGGRLWIGPTGLRLSGATLQSVNGIFGLGLISGANLGNVSFSTGHLLSGSLQTGAIFAAGGSFRIVGNGQDGLARGLIFSGTFTSPVSWTLTTLANGKYDYILSGSVSGTIRGGGTTSGIISQMSFDTGTGYFRQLTGNQGGGGNLVVAPEAGSLSMLAMSFIGIGGAMWRKARL